jgi:NAD(P)-dependent dehydrogenase (short-subunit alcohol dehydrogenase family)
MTKVLIVGAKPDSLGWRVAQVCDAVGYTPVTAGLQAGQPEGEDYPLDLYFDDYEAIRRLLMEVQPKHIVCTAGLNAVKAVNEGDPRDWYRWHFEANVIGPMRLLEAFVSVCTTSEYLGNEQGPLHFVAISSNSARIPRTNSGAYCASKAALSMALRVAGREAMGGQGGYIVYGYEPGLLAGTPMTEQVARVLPDVPLTRMQGYAASGLHPADLAGLIVSNLDMLSVGFNGCLIPFDTGEHYEEPGCLPRVYTTG